VVAVTASALGDVRESARQAGCVDYLSKPIRVQSLFAMLQAHAGAHFVSDAADVATSDRSGPIEVDRRAAVADRLRSAVALGDVSAIMELAQHLAKGGPAEAAIGERMSRLATAFDFGGLSELANSLTTSA
jgi:DNA-binding response OmpR family regulator